MNGIVLLQSAFYRGRSWGPPQSTTLPKACGWLAAGLTFETRPVWQPHTRSPHVLLHSHAERNAFTWKNEDIYFFALRMYFWDCLYSLSWLSRLAAAPRLSEGKMSIPTVLVYLPTRDKPYQRAGPFPVKNKILYLHLWSNF